MKAKKANSDDKVARVMREFKNGTLRSASGKLVTDRAQAVAIALSEAGLSKGELEKAEILNKAKLYKRQLELELKKELSKDQNIKAEILKYFKTTSAPKDSEVHAIAERMGIEPDILERHIYQILSDLMGGGKSKGEEIKADQAQIDEGMKVESEHTDDPEVARKIVMDHLAEDKSYYEKLSQAGL